MAVIDNMDLEYKQLRKVINLHSKFVLQDIFKKKELREGTKHKSSLREANLEGNWFS